ncbi:MAG: hypothetical protein ACOYLR_04510 [Chlorobium sp.]
MKHPILLSAVAASLLLGGCETVQPVAQKTQLQVREAQSRLYDVSDMKLVMKALMNTLQDDNFIVQQANVDLGLLTAQKELDIENPTESFFARAFTDRPEYKKNSITEASANISEFGKQIRVRINFRYKVLNNKGAVMRVSQIDDDRYYQDFFAKVDKSLYLGKQKIQ